MKLTDHFELEELVASQIATRRRIDNRPGPAEVVNLRRVAELLEQVRALIDAPVEISSGYRCPMLNLAIGGAKNSAHVQGLAADINVRGTSSRALAVLIRDSDIQFDQLIFEGTWVHIGLAVGKPRRQVLTATFAPGGVVYSQGIV